VLLQARDTLDALRLRANRLKVWRKGKVLAESLPVTSELRLPGREGAISFTRGG
jgi:cytosine deaminase